MSWRHSARSTSSRQWRQIERGPQVTGHVDRSRGAIDENGQAERNEEFFLWPENRKSLPGRFEVNAGVRAGV
jgi:hypothetical protein